MNAADIRQSFLDFFKGKEHKIVPSAPIVTKDDPTLLFTNAGMNQFKDYFLGNREPDSRRIADTQKCLRVSGKHNDLEEVGRDSYHHTMFEMLGNWSIGDYFKEEAIEWAWELLTDVYGLPKERLYATVFAGDDSDGLDADEEAARFWSRFLPDERILRAGKKDNFWEMGDTGPCGPCSEIHIDLRGDEERAKVDGAVLVNRDDPHVVELWNLVFIQFNRKADGSLQALPEKHVDTGMGLERLCMALQGKDTNYATDLFMPFIERIEKDSGIKYSGSYEADAKSDIAMRVCADHLRAVCFTIADGELPSNTGAGYVVRRILRRAIRYYYSFLGIGQPYLHKLVGILAGQFKSVFPELDAQREFVAKVIEEEEKSFLRTLEEGLKRLEQLDLGNGRITGRDAFELYDTYGFPIDLTRLIAEEKGVEVDIEGFHHELQKQKERSRADAKMEVGDWQEVVPVKAVEFIGYDQTVSKGSRIARMRTVSVRGEPEYQLVLDKTPFYPEGGGQVGDTGVLRLNGEKIEVIDTRKDNELIIHIVDSLPQRTNVPVEAAVDTEKRRRTANNHSATHLLHASLRAVLGDHVQQKGSLVHPEYLRFDFSHYQKVGKAELLEIERMVNEKIRADIPREERRAIPIEEAKAAGALMLFGEKYGDRVRMITFDPDFSRELCGGIHVSRTGRIGYFKITAESAVAAGVRRIEARTAEAAEEWVNEKLELVDSISSLLKSPDPLQAVESLQGELRESRKELDRLRQAQAGDIKEELKSKVQQLNGQQLIAALVPISDSKALKTLAFELERELQGAIVILGAEINEKPQLMMAVNRELAGPGQGKVHAGNIIREAAKEVRGGGGGQPFFASAGGSDAGGLQRALDKAQKLVEEQLK